MRIAAILSALLLTLWTAASSNSHRASHGFMLGVAFAPESCEDNKRVIMAVATGEHRAGLNPEGDLSLADFAARLREVMRYTAERVVYVKADADISWGEFVELVDHVWPETDIVSIITPKVEAQFRKSICIAPCEDCKRLLTFHPPR